MTAHLDSSYVMVRTISERRAGSLGRMHSLFWPGSPCLANSRFFLPLSFFVSRCWRSTRALFSRRAMSCCAHLLVLRLLLPLPLVFHAASMQKVLLCE